MRRRPSNVAVTAAKFPFLFGGTFIEAVTVCISETESTRHFPSFSEGLSLRVRFAEHALTSQRRFPFLFGGAFIEASTEWAWRWKQKYFPSFWEGLSLRRRGVWVMSPCARAFPFLLGRAFIEAPKNHPPQPNPLFPFLLGRAFIEGLTCCARRYRPGAFPFLFGRAFIEAPAD